MDFASVTFLTSTSASRSLRQLRLLKHQLLTRTLRQNSPPPPLKAPMPLYKTLTLNLSQCCLFPWDRLLFQVAPFNPFRGAPPPGESKAICTKGESRLPTTASSEVNAIEKNDAPKFVLNTCGEVAKQGRNRSPVSAER
jgi:hypothetical protein